MATLNYTYKCIIEGGSRSHVTQEVTPTSTQKPTKAPCCRSPSSPPPLQLPDQGGSGGAPLFFSCSSPFFYRCRFSRDQASTSGLRRFSLPALDPGRSPLPPGPRSSPGPNPGAPMAWNCHRPRFLPLSSLPSTRAQIRAPTVAPSYLLSGVAASFRRRGLDPSAHRRP